MKYASIIINLNTKKLQDPFVYLIPESLEDEVKIGSVVDIPFGKGNKIRKGYVIELSDSLSFDVKKYNIKEVSSVSRNISFASEMVELAVFISKRYFTTLNKAFNTILPTKIGTSHKKEVYVKLIKNDDFILSYIQDNTHKKSFSKRILVLKYLLKYRNVKRKDLLKDLNVSRSVLETLERSRLIDLHSNVALRLPYDSSKIARTNKLVANREQENAINIIRKSMLSDKSEVFLLHGITGSGKTEVYLQTIEEVIAMGKSAIFLIPEISLTHQTVRRVMARFGDVVGVIHSRLSAGEKYDQWKMAKEGKLKVIIGPRSAVFTPFLDIGIIIIDEEHESTYKSEQEPKYNAREVAIKRAHYHKCPVILGSATPLVENYYKAINNKYKLLKLKDKAENDKQIQVDVIDMRQEIKNNNNSIFSKALSDAIKDRLEKKEQIILFLNSRAYSRSLNCLSCGYVAKCSHCDVSYHYHKKENALICHYCDSRKAVFRTCPKCGSDKIKALGIGTQKVEQLVGEAFPSARVLRMDLDTTGGKFGHDEIISSFANHEADILVGTQMVVKGHHFSNVTLVGVLSADISLYTNDYRSSERTFELITQVIGRAGRGLKEGRGIIQTYSPSHYSIESSRTEDYISFYKREIAFRKMGEYPPFTNILVLTISSKNERYAEKLINRLSTYLKKDDDRYEVLGPTKPSRDKLADSYRRVIYVKSKSYALLLQMIDFINEVKIKEDYEKNAILSIDINPTYMWGE